MERRPGRALATTYVRLTPTGKFQARSRNARTGLDVKASSSTFESAVEKVAKKAARS
jgi:nucleoid DNA-binding protein